MGLTTVVCALLLTSLSSAHGFSLFNLLTGGGRSLEKPAPQVSAALPDVDIEDAFEAAFSLTFNGTEDAARRTLVQFEDTISFLIQSPQWVYSQIHELHSFGLQEVVYYAIQLAAIRKNETTTLKLLDFISHHLSQVRLTAKL